MKSSQPAPALGRTADEHRQDEDRFRLLVDSVSDYAIFILDPKGYVETWNLGAERIKGYLADEIIGKHFSAFYTPEDIAARKCELELEVAAREGRSEDEGWRVRKGGGRFWANVVITALRSSAGVLVGYAKVTRDLTERRAAEQEAQRFRLLVESVKDYAIFILDPKGHVMTWNPGAERLKGYKTGEIVGKHFSAFYDPTEVRDGKCERELAVASETGRFEEEGWRFRKDGTRLWANVTITALHDQQGGLVGFAKVTRDLTERRHAEDERVRLARAEEAEQRTTDFLAVMGHELRNPLAPMVVALHLVKLRGGRNCDREIGVLERQLTHMTRLVDDLLDVSRTLHEKVRLVRRPLEIGDVLANALDVAAPIVERKRHVLTVDAPAGLVVEGDSERLTQVFGNILNNAAKYTDSGGKISIRATADDEWVTVTIEDSGIGMAQELLPRVFELFTQAEQGLDRSQGGLGVGLSVARRLVEEHGGDVVAASEGIGRGSRFCVRLPRSAGKRLDAPAVPANEAPRGAARRVLVVDDNDDSADMVRLFLEDLGHEIRVASDGPTALEAAASFAPEMVLLDIGLPGLSGYEVAERMRHIPSCIDIPIIAMTGYARDTDRAQAERAGFTAHLAKPISIDRLETLVHELAGCRSVA
jgi:PAS domain S-box-containing protein